MDRGLDAGVAVVPDVNVNANANVNVNVNANVRGERRPAVVPIGHGESPVAGIGTGEGMILPPQSERWLSGIVWASPSTQRARSFMRTPEMVIFLLGLASLLSLIIFISDVINTHSFRPLTVTIFVSAGAYCIVLIRRQRSLATAEQAVLAEIMEARAADPSRRVITKEERQSLFHYFTLRPRFPGENASSCEDNPPGENAYSAASGASTPSGEGNRRGEDLFSRRALVRSSSSGEETGEAKGGDPTIASIPSRDGPLGGGEGSVPTRGETRAVESETRRGGRRSGSLMAKLFRGPRTDHVINAMESVEEHTGGQQHLGVPRKEEGVSAGAVTGCSGDAHACSAPEEKEKEKDAKQGQALRRASWQWGTGGQCVVCFGEYSYGEDLCRLPCCHMYHAECIDEWLDGANHGWCPVCKKSLLGDGQDQETSESGRGTNIAVAAEPVGTAQQLVGGEAV